MKRFLSALLALSILITPALALADYDYDSIKTPNVIVVDANDTSTVFYERNADQKIYPASTTKIMTALIALENGNLDDEFAVGEEVLGTTTKFSSYSSLMGIQPGETYTLRELVYGLMLVSGNDAAEAIAKHIAGSVDAFVNLMNQKAAELGMTNTHFANPHGTPNDDHYSTPRDMANLMADALKNEAFIQIAETKEYTIPADSIRTTDLVLHTTDRLLVATAGDTIETVYPYAIAGKTGDTDTAGKCLVAAAEKDGARLIYASFGDKKELYDGDTETTNLARFVNAANVFEYVFDNGYQKVSASELGLQTTFTTGVVNADAEDLKDGQLTMTVNLDNVSIRALPDKSAAIKSNASSITTNMMLTTDAQAPITAGQSMGIVEYKVGDDVIYTAPLTADFAVDQSLEGATVQSDTTASVTNSPDSTPLIDKGHKDWTTADYLTLTFVLLLILLIALIVIFVISERKRRYERKRRARAKQRARQQY